MFEFFEEEVLLDVGEVFVEVVGEVVPEEFLEEEGLHLGEHIDAALLAVEGFELGVVPRLVSLLLHPISILITGIYKLRNVTIFLNPGPPEEGPQTNTNEG